ncbi:MAG: VanZ family protein [Flavobacteriales bacterium]|jgi:VanZ family protein|nr:VanZ family protein [Flavobacteriales bacterium]
MILAVLWTAFIIYGLTSVPSGIPRFEWLAWPGVDKLIHLILFGVEAGLLALAFAKDKEQKWWLPILIWCFVLGGGLEVVQHNWVEGRSGDVIDLMADILGAVVGLVVVRDALSKRSNCY